ncbi:MAG TPA: undecaprenyl-diphosphatase UppP [Patescibacteria group bacterium]|nr:undecaprenyl-diphosphatase UppP [Patescibacteria group bacterium]
MIYIYSLIFGFIQGITEFVPISSSGHLVVLHDIWQLSMIDNLAFDVALHLGTALAVIIFFRIKLLRYIVVVLQVFLPKRTADKDDLKEALLLIYATIPAAIVGGIFSKHIESFFRNTWTVIITLSVGAVLFFWAERVSQKKKDFSQISIVQAVYIGIAQVLALIPGVSRSGITIIAGMSAKLKRAQAAKFSFLMSVPIILGAGFFQMIKVKWELLSQTELYLFALGFISSFVVGYLVIKFLLKFLEKHSLRVFAWYRLGLALILLIWMILR